MVSEEAKNEQAYEFLAGLNRKLDDVRGRVFGRQPLPSFREAFAEVRNWKGKNSGLKEATGLRYYQKTLGLVGQPNYPKVIGQPNFLEDQH